jgi:hypothetical protein
LCELVIPVSSSIPVLLTKCYSGRQIKMNEMCTYGGRGEVRTGLWWGYLRGTNHLKDQGVDEG